MTSAPRVCSSRTLERATRLCRTSPTIVTRRPARSVPGAGRRGRLSRRRIVNASSSAWVGCSWVPSPALTTAPRIQPEWASRCGAPEAWWRTTTASAPIASRVSAVSLRLSPLETLEPLAEKLMTSADSRLAAASNEIRVRVESSKNRLTTVRPRRVGSFLIGRSASRASSSAVSRTSSASSRVEVGGGEQVLVHRAVPSPARAVPSMQDLRRRRRVSSSSTRTRSPAGGGQVLADVVGADRQLAVAAVDQDGELDRLGPPEVAERVEGGPDRAAGVEHVVDEDDDAAVDALRRAGRCAPAPGPGAAAGRRGTSSRRASRRARRRPRRRRSGRPAGGPAGRRGSGCRAGRGPVAPLLRSRISWAMRVSARAMSAASRTDRCGGALARARPCCG